MLRSIRVALVAAVALPMLAVPVLAIASPTPTPTSVVQAQSTSDHIYVTVTVNAGQAEFVRTASKLLRNGRNNTHLDWRKAKSYWGKHTATRDQFASGWVKAGGKLDNASQSTITRLKNYPSGLDRVAKANPSSAERKPNCKGENKVTHPNSYTEDHYYDSCRTSDILAHFDTCARWAGFVSLLTYKWKPAAAVGPLLIAACGQAASPIKSARARATWTPLSRARRRTRRTRAATRRSPRFSRS